MFVYSQSTGELLYDGVLLATGYAGYGEGRNNPHLENVENVGPIPKGLYLIGEPRDSKRTGPHVLDLTPVDHDALGRTSFQIHGDNRTNDASHGCIIMPRKIREYIAAAESKMLQVVG